MEKLPEKIPVRVSRKHIRKGKPRRNAACALALAINQAVPGHRARVYLDRCEVKIQLYQPELRRITLYRPIPNQRKRMLDFVQDYDLSDGEVGEPTRFTLARIV